MPYSNFQPPSRFDELPEDLDGKLPGSFDDGDPQTTNLYVGNLAPQVSPSFVLGTIHDIVHFESWLIESWRVTGG